LNLIRTKQNTQRGWFIPSTSQPQGIGVTFFKELIVTNFEIASDLAVFNEQKLTKTCPHVNGEKKFLQSNTIITVFCI